MEPIMEDQFIGKLKEGIGQLKHAIPWKML